LTGCSWYGKNEAMGNNSDARSAARQHDEKIFRDGAAIFSEGDLRELINMAYSEYQYQGDQLDKLAGLIDFLALESNRYIDPDFAVLSRRLSDWLDNFREFLQRNFHVQTQIENKQKLYLLTMGETGFETEAFLTEFQMVSMDVLKAYLSYQAAILGKPEP
jgi:hypothetical protein